MHTLPFFVHLSSDRHLGRFHGLAIVNESHLSFYLLIPAQPSGLSLDITSSKKPSLMPGLGLGYGEKGTRLGCKI